jgi:putative transposase
MMTEERMALIELVEKQADGDLVREMLAFAAERIMEAEVEVRTGATKGARTPMREVQRDGYSDRDWDTRAGRIALEIPKLRKGVPSAPSQASSNRGGRRRGPSWR